MSSDQFSARASILDMLIVPTQEEKELGPKRMSSLNMIKASVTRDLLNLLNTRRRIYYIFDSELDETVKDSLYTYGVRDFISMNPKDDRAVLNLANDIKETIHRFENRLSDLKVIAIKGKSDKKQDAEYLRNIHNLKFRIEGILIVEPYRVPIRFDTEFNVNKGKYSINEIVNK